ncbi:hypothetical protein BDZ45DRAFT_237420 [Acephala macrosclerotiorum]|nr:hypothetical protein BDZ45DRAFT_237420 [Acephala macrosclerotiorum]
MNDDFWSSDPVILSSTLLTTSKSPSITMPNHPGNADRNENRQASNSTQPDPTGECSLLQVAMPMIADAFQQYFVEHKEVGNDYAQSLGGLEADVEQALRTTEFSYLVDLLALLQDFQNNVNAGRGRSYNDTTDSLQSLIDRCTAHLARGDALESFKLAGDLLAWLVGELQSRKERYEQLGGVYQDQLGLLESIKDHVAAI